MLGILLQELQQDKKAWSSIAMNKIIMGEGRLKTFF
jgi:hypothetical protein